MGKFAYSVAGSLASAPAAARSPTPMEKKVLLMGSSPILSPASSRRRRRRPA